MKRILTLLLTLALTLGLFAGCTVIPVSTDTGNQTGAPETTEASPELKEELAVPVPEGVTATEDNARVFYEIFVGSFSDSNGDGVGDLRGIINRMDYLNDGNENSGKSLGVEGLWLTPIFDSNSYHKYDINDYYAVDPDFGSLEDLKELAELCHQRNVKLILDLPINHTSRYNAWFSAFVEAHRSGNTEDPYYNFYSFYSKGDSAPAGRTFSALSGTDDYYECNFDGGMPELNFDSEEVRQAVLDVAKFYLELGIDGFRFDAAKYVYFGDNAASVEFWVWYMEQLRAIKPEIYVVGEVWDGDGVTGLYYPAMNCFDFTTSQAEGLIAKTAGGDDVTRYVSYLDSYLDSIAGENPDSMLVSFIANHDTDRSAGYLPSFNGRAQMAANILLLTPGSPFIYYGEEIGLRGSRGGANTDANRRLPMVWGDGDTVADPKGTSYAPENRADSPVTEQIAAENSLYNYYKKVILLRKANPEIARGDFSPVSVQGSNAGGFTAEWNGSRVLVLHNPSNKAVVLDLNAMELAEFAKLSGFVGMGSALLEGSSLTLDAQTSAVLRVS